MSKGPNKIFYLDNNGPVLRIPIVTEKAYTPNFSEAKKPPGDQDWFAFMEWSRGETNTLLGKFYTNRLTPDQFGDELYRLLQRSHRAAQVLGRQRAISRRAQMYNSRLRGTASIAFETNSPDGTSFVWKLGPAEHCEDCLDLAVRSPWMKGELPVFPGDGGTDCLVNCKCWLVRNDGLTSFPPDKGVGKAEVGEDVPGPGGMPGAD